MNTTLLTLCIPAALVAAIPGCAAEASKADRSAAGAG